MDEYIGVIKFFAGNYAPANWMFCNGQFISIQSNPALYSILGTTYGGDGSTNFALPNLCGCMPVGAGQGNGLPFSIEIGETGGTPITELIWENMPAHTHLATVGGQSTLKVSSGNATQSAATNGASIATPGNGSGRSFAPTLGFTTSTPDTAINGLNVSQINIINELAGGSMPFNNMPPFLGSNFIICVTGLYPQHP